MSIAQERCFNHASREAVARCPECGRTFCRECVSEHEDRVICAFCLKRLSQKAVRRYPLARLTRLAQILMGMLLLWSSFYLLGKALLTIPSAFHEAAVGQVESVDR
ncbi:MAG TPA: rhomboid family protein [Thermodesulfobacteriota bacterium]|nr:rhomboid family protein [Thermodesulfobacteriota bacterium]